MVFLTPDAEAREVKVDEWDYNKPRCLFTAEEGELLEEMTMEWEKNLISSRD